jgi:hypothetical protein
MTSPCRGRDEIVTTVLSVPDDDPASAATLCAAAAITASCPRADPEILRRVLDGLNRL